MVCLRVDHKGDALLIGISETGLLIQVLDDLTQRQAIKFDFIDTDGIQLVINGLASGSSMDPISFGKWIGDRQLGLWLFPILLHFQQFILVGQELLAMGSGVLRLADDVQVLVSGTVVRVELDCFLKFGLGAFKATHLEGQLAVLDSDGGR